MAIKIFMSQFGPEMKEGKIIHWLKNEGDVVFKGESLLEVESEKAVVEIASPADGILGPILKGEESVVPVGELLSQIFMQDEIARQVASTPSPIASSPIEIETNSGNDESQRRSDGKSKVSPLARRLASELRVDISGVQGSGPGGRIIEADIHRAAEYAKTRIPIEPVKVTIAGKAPEITKPPARTPLGGVRALIASRMQLSHQTTAPVTLTTEADASALVELRDQLKTELDDELGFPLGYNEILIKIVAKSLQAYPYMNARLEEKHIQIMPEINIGLGVDTDRGLLAVVVKNANQKGLAEISREVHGLVDKARKGIVLPEDLVGGTFTITNLGMLDIDTFTPIINLPEVAILGVGQIKPRPFVVNGQLVVRDTVWLSLTFDHRIIDGAPAGRFLKQIKQLIQFPGLFIKG